MRSLSTRSRGAVMVACGVVFLGLANAVLAPARATLTAPLRACEMLRLTGPVRGLPLPFLWRAWANAERANSDRVATGIGEWLSEWLPERIDLFLYFAWSHAYDLGHSATTPQAKARHLVDAIVLIEKARRQHPNSDEPAALAAFLLVDRASQDGEPLSSAFASLYGQRPIELASRYLAATEPGVARQTDELGQVLATRLLERGNLDLAALLLRRLTRIESAKSTPLQQQRIRELLDFVDRARAGQCRFPGDLDQELRAWLINDRLFGRNPELWR